MSDRKPSTEEQVDRIKAIKGNEVLGYEGGARAEHSGGQEPAQEQGDLEDDLADNRPDQT